MLRLTLVLAVLAILHTGACFRIARDQNDLQFSGESWSKTLSNTDDLSLDHVEDLDEALRKLKPLEERESQNWKYLIKMAEVYWKLALNGRNKISYEEKKDRYFKAQDYAKKALKFNAKSSDVHKWFAVTLGSLGEYVGLNQKIKDGHTFQKHIKMAMKITNQDSHLFHLYGRFCFEVSDLSWLERSIASALFTIPTATKEDALSYFEKAERLEQDWGENQLYLAKCHIHFGNYQKAARLLDSASETSPKTTDSDGIYEEIAKLKAKCEGYL